MPDIGELVVGAWLTQVQGYDFVVYNQHPGRDLPDNVAPKGAAGVSARLAELDVIGLHTPDRRSYLAECTTHLDGLLYGSSVEASMQKLTRKFAVAGAYARILESRTELRPALALWSPKVPKAIVDRSAELEAAAERPVELVANKVYADRVAEIADAAKQGTSNTGNDFYRTLQLLTHLSHARSLALPPAFSKKVSDITVTVNAGTNLLPWGEVVKVHKTQAGIRAPRGGAAASIICNTSPRGPYPDRFLGPDVLHYVGRGVDGDQALDRDNESLRQATERGVPIRVFEQLGRNKYLDHGTWVGVGEPLWHLDATTSRRLIVFPLARWGTPSSAGREHP